MFSCGFDADVVNRLHRTRRGPIRHLSYLQPILASLGSYRFPQLDIRFQREGTTVWESTQASWIFAFNFPCYARGFRLASQANPTDGQFDVCLFRGRSVAAGLFHFATVVCHIHGEWSGCDCRRVTRLKISPVRETDRVPFQIDGDPGGDLPVEIDILSKRLTLLVPDTGS